MTLDGGRLGGLSLAEYEYAQRFGLHLSLGDERPDSSGFDPERVAIIETLLREVWAVRRDRMRRRPRVKR